MVWYRELVESLPNVVRQLLEKIWDEGFYTTLVGGCVRDFYVDHQLVHDLDFEIRKDENFTESEWNAEVNRLRCELQKAGFNADELMFNILRVSLPSWDIELASPREEIFDEANHSHKNFKAQYKSNMDYTTAFARRDFTINAIGIEIRNWDKIRLVDPFAGICDIKRGVLRACGLNFVKDPVRLLRAVRFQILTGYQFDRTLTYQWSSFFLNDLSDYYIVQEAKKSGDIYAYFNNLFAVIDSHHVPGNASLTQLHFFADIEKDDNIDFSMVEEVAFYLITQLNKVSEINLNNFSRIFGLKKMKIVLLRRYLKNLVLFNDDDLQTAKNEKWDENNIHHPLIEKCERLVNYRRKASWNQTFEKFMDIFFKNHIQVIHGLELDQGLQGEDDFLESLNNIEIPDAHKGRLRLVCHFKSLFSNG
ncbi:MAG: hypothetical protein ACOCUH_00140 [Bacteriovoracia bacterium]